MVDSEWLEIARLGRVRGLRGELFAKGEQTPEWYTALPEVRIRLVAGEWFGAGVDVEAQALRITEARTYSGRLVLRFSGIESATAAETLVSGLVFVSHTARPAAPEGEIWLSELVGCAVEDVRDGRLLGRVAGWQDYGGPFVTLEVIGELTGEAAGAANAGIAGVGSGKNSGPPILIPFVKSICVEVDLAGRKIRIDPPDGLLELNAGSSGGPPTDRE